VKPRPPESLIGVDVPDPGDTGLRQQERLERRRAVLGELEQPLRRELLRQRLDPETGGEELIELVGMLALYAGAMAQMFLNKTAWFYDCSYWFWIFIFLAAPSLLRALKARLTADNYAIKRSLAGGFCLVLLSSILSTVLSVETFYQDFNSGFGGPGIPIVTLNPAATKLSIERALAQCELSPAAPRLMVDDLTYPFVQRSYKPISASYALFLTSFLTSSGISPEEAVIRAKALGSSGMIFRCSNATAFPNLSFKEDGGICCTKFGE